MENSFQSPASSHKKACDQSLPLSPQCRVFFRSETLSVCVSFLPIRFITMVMCSLRLGLAAKSLLIDHILRCMVTEIPQVQLSAWKDALRNVPQNLIVPTINGVYLSFLRGVGVSRNLSHERAYSFVGYWIDEVSVKHCQPRTFADWRYSGYFSSKRSREGLLVTLRERIDGITNWHESVRRDDLLTPRGHTMNLNYMRRYIAVCNFLVELTQSSFSLEWLNIDGRKWGFRGMDTVNQDEPRLHISVNRADVERLNAAYAAAQSSECLPEFRFIPFEYDSASGMIWQTEFQFTDPLPSPV